MLLNIDRLQAGMKNAGLDALVATTPENVTYTSGFWAMSQWIRRGPQAYVLIPAKNPDDSSVIANTGMIDLAADSDVWVRDVRRFGKFIVDATPDLKLSGQDRRMQELLDREDDGDAVKSLARAIKDRGLQSAKIGIDEIGILPEYWDALVELLPDAKLTRASGIFRYARAIKTAEEIIRLRKSAQIADLSIAAAFDIAREGATEMDLAKVFHCKTIEEGGLPVLGCVGTGPRGAMTNVQPNETKIVKGEVIRFDVGGRYRHYRADIARNAVVGDADAKTVRYHKAICAGMYRAIEMIKPGVRVADVFDAAVETVRREGIAHYQRNHIGHGIGLDGYDAPNIAPSNNESFEEGMVICVETPYYEMGYAGLQAEDTLVVTKDGVDSFMLSNAALRLL
jgi:Xaa-Pro dipeptidase